MDCDTTGGVPKLENDSGTKQLQQRPHNINPHPRRELGEGAAFA